MNNNLKTALYLAIEKNNLHLAKLLVDNFKNQIDINFEDNTIYETALYNSIIKRMIIMKPRC